MTSSFEFKNEEIAESFISFWATPYPGKISRIAEREGCYAVFTTVELPHYKRLHENFHLAALAFRYAWEAHR